MFNAPVFTREKSGHERFHGSARCLRAPASSQHSYPPRGKSFPTRPKSPRATKTKIHRPAFPAQKTDTRIPSVFPLKIGAQMHGGYEGKLQTRGKTLHFMPLSLICSTTHFFPTFAGAHRPIFYEEEFRKRAKTRQCTLSLRPGALPPGPW